MKAQWDWRAVVLTRPGTQKPGDFGLILAALAARCDRNFRLVFPGDGRRCFIAYREPQDNGGFLDTLESLATAANLELNRVNTDAVDWPEPKHVLQLAEPQVGAAIPKIIRDLANLSAITFHSQGGQMLKVFVANGNGTIPQAEAFRAQKSFSGGQVFWPGQFSPRNLLSGGITFDDLTLGFYLDQFELELSPVSVQVGKSETGSPVFVDAGRGHVLILGPANSKEGRSIGNQLALKAAQASQIVVVIQPQTGEDLGVFRSPRIVSTRQDDRSIAEWQRQVLVGPGLTVVQGHPGGDALERIKSILEGLWNSAQMECHRDGWPGMTVAINDFIPTASEPRADTADRRTLPPYRHQLYELIAQMAGGFNAIRLVLLGRPSVVFGVEHLRAVIGSFGQIVRLRTVAEGYPPGEGYSHDRYVDQEFREWLHEGGAHDRCLVLTPEGWIRTKLEVPEPEVEAIAEPTIQVLRPDEVQQPHRWPTRERREPTAQPWGFTPTATEPPTSAADLERLLKAKGFLPISPKEKGALEELKVQEAEAQAAVGAAEAETEEPVCRTELSNKVARTLKHMLDLVDVLVEKHGFTPHDLRALVLKGVKREDFVAFLAGEISRDELLSPAARAQTALEKRVRDLKEDHEGLAQVLPAAAIA